MCSSLRGPAVGLLLALAAAARADLIFLKDGFVIQGKVHRESTSLLDPHSKETITIPKGFFYVDDGARRYYFGPRQVQDVDQDFQVAEDNVTTGRFISIVGPQRQPVILDIADPGTWDAKWNRIHKYKTLTYEVTVPQHLSLINAQHLRVDATKTFRWSSYYLTRELSHAQFRKLLKDHPDFATPADLEGDKKASRRMRLYYLTLNAGWLDEAEAELDAIEKELPEAKSKATEARAQLQKMQARRRLDDLLRADKAGRFRWVVEQLRTFPEKDVTSRMAEEYRALKTSYEKTAVKEREVWAALADLVGRLKDEGDQAYFKEVLKEIGAGIHRDHLERFDTFLKQYQQAVRQEKAGAKPEQTPPELLAMAVSGWVLGRSETKLQTTRSLWQARKFLLAYLRAETDADREALRRDFDKQQYRPTIDEMAQLIRRLPPPRAEPKPPEGTVEMTTDSGKYLVQLPHEYTHARPWPVLVVLHGGGDRPKHIFDRWAEAAREHGYILAAPEWTPVQGGGYGYTADDHEVVLKTLRDLKMRFQVDCDRVFLHGYRQGGNMAYDVGLSHPDLFAGVLPVSAAPELFSRRYWPNAQYLPFYVVSGTHVGDPLKFTRDQFDKWMPHGYPTLWVVYKGRGIEWFPAEVPNMFDWMNRKKRSVPATTLGRYGGPLGDEFSSLRTTDNRFYWISSDSVNSGHINSAVGWNPRIMNATLTARIDPGANHIAIQQRGFNRLTLWLTRESGVDFERPVTVMVNTTRYSSKPEASLSVLLDDYRDRLDRQNLYIARLEVKN